MSNFCCKRVAARCHQDYTDSERSPCLQKDERREFLTESKFVHNKSKFVEIQQSEMTKEVLSLAVMEET